VREAPGTTFKLADLLARPVLRFRILSPLADSLQHGGRASVKIAIEALPIRSSEGKISFCPAIHSRDSSSVICSHSPLFLPNASIAAFALPTRLLLVLHSIGVLHCNIG
jgi:hypothetical protein